MEMTYKRAQFKEILGRLEEPRSKMQVIVGPRQVGKTTLIGQVLEESVLPFDNYSADDVTGVSSDWLSQIWLSMKPGNIIPSRNSKFTIMRSVMFM